VIVLVPGMNTLVSAIDNNSKNAAIHRASLFLCHFCCWVWSRL